MCIRHLAASKRCLICAPQSLSVSRQHYHSLFPNWETETERFSDMPQITWSAGKWQSLDSHTGLLTPRGHPPPPAPARTHAQACGCSRAGNGGRAKEGRVEDRQAPGKGGSVWRSHTPLPAPPWPGQRSGWSGQLESPARGAPSPVPGPRSGPCAEPAAPGHTRRGSGFSERLSPAPPAGMC